MTVCERGQKCIFKLLFFLPSLVGLWLILTFAFRNEYLIGLGWAAFVFQIWPWPYVVQKTLANKSDTSALFSLAKSGWKTSKHIF